MRQPITKEQVFRVADGLAATGIRVTVDSVRELTGGSDETVNRFLRLWKGAHDIPLRKPLSESEKESILSERAKSERQLADLQDANQALLARSKQQEADISRLLGKIEDLKKELAELTERNAQNERERAALLSDRAKTERQLTDLQHTIQVLFDSAELTAEKTNRLTSDNEGRIQS